MPSTGGDGLGSSIETSQLGKESFVIARLVSSVLAPAATGYFFIADRDLWITSVSARFESAGTGIATLYKVGESEAYSAGTAIGTLDVSVSEKTLRSFTLDHSNNKLARGEVIYLGSDQAVNSGTINGCVMVRFTTALP